jgi:FlaG/FlaF family flagellin (archaellin)
MRYKISGKMKGITPVVSVILLIMISISMVGLLFVWFSGFLPTILNNTETQMSMEQRQRQMNIRFISASEVGGSIAVSIRNSGTVDIRPGELVILASKGTSVLTPYYTYQSSIAPQGTTPVFDTGISLSSCTAGENVTVKADIPGQNDDIVSITCT